jgi:transcriptional regulator with XRE-family HTH domain
VATLKASPQGLERIKQARSAKGWAVSDFRWIEAASESLGTSWAQAGVLAAGISEGTWKRFLAGKSPINAESFKAYCRVLGLEWQEVIEQDKSQSSLTSDLSQAAFSALSTIPPLVQDWSEAPDVSIFYGRQAELSTVRQWVVQENCRFITLLGMGGIGKTALSVRLAREIVNQQNASCEAIAQDRIPFSSVIWRSLRNAPSIEDLLARNEFTDATRSASHSTATLSPKFLLSLGVRQRRINFAGRRSHRTLSPWI